MKELTEQQLKKREYNKTQREKKKLLKEQEKAQKEVPNIEIIKDGDEDYIEDGGETTISDDGKYVLDKETYEYLLSKAKISKEVKEEKEESKKEVVNFQNPQQPTIMQMLKNQTISMAVGVIPILALQGLVLGVKYASTLKKRSEQQQNTFVLPMTNQYNMDEQYFTR